MTSGRPSRSSHAIASSLVASGSRGRLVGSTRFWVNDNEVAYTEPGQCLDKQHPDASGANYGNFRMPKDLLPFITV